MKKLGVFVILFSLLLIAIVSAQTEQTLDDKAKSCINSKLGTDCAGSKNVEEISFALLASGNSKCNSNLNDLKSKDEDCWPSSSCNVKDTALAVLATGSSGGQKWLLNHNRTLSQLGWYLQIDSSEATTCTVTCGSASNTINIGADKTISSGESLQCFDIAAGNYWLRILDDYISSNITITCDKNFISTLMYQKPGSDTWYVSSQTESASANGNTRHKIDFFCISKSEGSDCDYEENLWAALALKNSGNNIDKMIPYLTAFSEDNENVFPQAFLQIFTGDYLSDVSSLEADSHWEIGEGKYFDTALAILAIAHTPSETLTWLANNQDSKGCWGNLRDTSALLWARGVEAAGGGGGVINLTTPTNETCEEQNGKICQLNEECSGVSLTVNGEKCCFGTCGVPGVKTDCENQGYNCRASCYSDETEAAYSCTTGQVCCKPSAPPATECENNNYNCRSSCYATEEEKLNYSASCSAGEICCGEISVPPATPATSWTWLIVTLSILIVLAILAIIFRNQLKVFMSRFKKGPPAVQKRPPYFPPAVPTIRRPMPMPMQKPVPRMIKPVTKSETEFEETMKKLKELSK